MHTTHRLLLSETRRAALRALAALSLLCLGAAAASAADNSSAQLSDGPRFVEKDGESLYRAICQSCHMPEGEGAQGAGMYPPLARNATLASARYPIYNILHGRKGMPGFEQMLSDEQVAEVTNYVRTHLGNNYPDPVTAADVKKLR